MRSGYYPRVTVIGTGYLGLTHAVCMADLGHEVLAIDVDKKKIAKAAAGEAPFFEPGLEPLLGYDARIGNRFLAPGLGFGGGCLPKDIRAFSATASALGVGSLISLLNTVDTINLGRRDRVISLAREAVGGELAGKRVAVLGGAFKPNSDDIRDSPSLDACDRLVAEGAIVSVQTR